MHAPRWVHAPGCMHAHVLCERKHSESVSFGRFSGEIRRQLDRKPGARGLGNGR